MDRSDPFELDVLSDPIGGLEDGSIPSLDQGVSQVFVAGQRKHRSLGPA